MNPFAASTIIIAGLLVLFNLAWDHNHLPARDFDRAEVLVMYFVSGGLLLLYSNWTPDPLVVSAFRFCGSMSVGVGVHYLAIYMRDYLANRKTRHRGPNT